MIFIESLNCIYNIRCILVIYEYYTYMYIYCISVFFIRASTEPQGFAETDRNCLGRKSQLQYWAVAAIKLFHSILTTMNRIQNYVYQLLCLIFIGRWVLAVLLRNTKSSVYLLVVRLEAVRLTKHRDVWRKEPANLLQCFGHVCYDDETKSKE